jgi:hypothetical protein
MALTFNLPMDELNYLPSTLLKSEFINIYMSVEENIKIVRRAIEAFNTGNTSNADQFISPDYVNSVTIT